MITDFHLFDLSVLTEPISTPAGLFACQTSGFEDCFEKNCNPFDALWVRSSLHHTFSPTPKNIVLVYRLTALTPNASA